jgi:hypothetical protein
MTHGEQGIRKMLETMEKDKNRLQPRHLGEEFGMDKKV